MCWECQALQARTGGVEAYAHVLKKIKDAGYAMAQEV